MRKSYALFALVAAMVVQPVQVRPPPDWMAESNQKNALMGASHTAGDVNGDGFDDVLVGAYRYDEGQSDEGAAFLYYGSASGLALVPGWTAQSDQAGSQFGLSVSGAGDVNGDGYGDVVIGAPSYDEGQSDEGAAFVYYGSATGPSEEPDWVAESNQAKAKLGSARAAGDVNGDGFGDLIVGATGYTDGQAGEGAAFLYFGSLGGLSQTPDWIVQSNQPGARFGQSVNSAGDVNDDGFDDLIVGAAGYTNGQTMEGRAFVYYGSLTGPSTTPDWTAESNQASAAFGLSVGSAGDVDGDGDDEVIVGAPHYSNGQSLEGRAYLYEGSPLGLGLTASWITESNRANPFYGGSVGTAGDVDADGFADVLVGSDEYTNGQMHEGRLYLYFGSATGLTSQPWIAEANQPGASFGGTAATAGDVNGDGFDDFVVGAGHFNDGQTAEGAAFAYYGRAP